MPASERLRRLAKRLQPLLIAEKAPLGFVALAGFVAWGLTHVVDRFLESPTLEYECALKEKQPGMLAVSCLVRNLSRERVFTKLHLILRVPMGLAGTLMDPRIEWLGTTHPGNSGNAPEGYGDSAEYVIPALHPNSSARLNANLSGGRDIEFRMWSEGDQGIRCVESSWATWIVRNEALILLLLVMLAALAIPSYLALLLLAQDKPKGSAEPFE